MLNALILAALLGDARNPADYPTVCVVSCSSRTGGRDVGSGCCVYSQASPPVAYVLTASHVLRDRRGRPAVRFADGTQHTGQVVLDNPIHDVALVALATHRSHYTPISDEQPAPGDPVTFCGYGGERPYFLAYAGRVTGAPLSSDGATPNIVEAGVRASQGDSGGPVFYRGRVLGVIGSTDGRASQATVVGYETQCRGGNCPPPGRRIFRPCPLPVPRPPQNTAPPPAEKSQPGATGPAGPPGPQGPPGPAGPALERAEVEAIVINVLKRAELDLSEQQLKTLTDSVAKRLPPVVLEIEDGGQVFRESRPLGEPIRLRVTGLLEASR